MPNTYQRSLKELITRYELEPATRDVYVEGDRDISVLNWFFQVKGFSGIAVLPINSVDVPNKDVRKCKVSGNRGRVIALCSLIEEELGSNLNNLLGIIDKDYDCINEDVGLNESAYLVYTDFSCLECYAIEKSSLHKLFNLYFGKNISDSCIDNIFDILVSLFCIRAAKVYLSDAGTVKFERSLTYHDGVIHFDEGGYILKLVNASNGKLCNKSLEDKINEFKLRAACFDVRNAINGHDLVLLLSWFAHKIGVSSSICNQEALHRALITNMELCDISEAPLFSRLLRWACR